MGKILKAKSSLENWIISKNLSPIKTFIPIWKFLNPSNFWLKNVLYFLSNIGIDLGSVSANLKKSISVIYWIGRFQKWDLSVYIGIGRYEKNLIGHTLWGSYSIIGLTWCLKKILITLAKGWLYMYSCLYSIFSNA